MEFDLSRFALKEASKLLGTRVSFLKGPIPLAWLQAASKLPGKSLHVGVALWYISGLTKSKTVTLSNPLLKSLGVDRKAKARCLKSMERAGLVAVMSTAGRNPVVTLLNAPELGTTKVNDNRAANPVTPEVR